MKISELRNKLDEWDGEMEIIILDNNYMEYEIEDVQLLIKKKEPRLVLRID